MSEEKVNQKFLQFTIGTQHYAITLEYVKEVIAFPEITPVLSKKSFVLGIIDLRGKIVPIIDLRIKLGKTPTLTHDTAVMVCLIGQQYVGLVVDCIHTVVSPDEGQVMSCQLGVINSGMNFVSQIIKRDEGLSVVLSIGDIVMADDIIQLNLDQQLSGQGLAANSANFDKLIA